MAMLVNNLIQGHWLNAQSCVAAWLTFYRLPRKTMSPADSWREAEFNFLKEKTGATAGNLSTQISKFKEAGYLTLTKEFSGSYPLTRCAITPQGVTAFENYVQSQQRYLKPE